MKRNAHILSNSAPVFIFKLRLRGVQCNCFERHRSTRSNRAICTYRSPAHPTMKIVTWNVNGLKAVLNRRFGSIRTLLQYLKAGMLAFSATAARCSDHCSTVSMVSLVESPSNTTCRRCLYTRDQALESRHGAIRRACHLRGLVESPATLTICLLCNYRSQVTQT